MSDPKVILFMILPRSGTQWLTQRLQLILKDTACVDADPKCLSPQSKFWRNTLEDPQKYQNDLHHQEIHKHIKSGIYIQSSGIGCWTIPLTINEFNGNVKLVHIMRNPYDNIKSILKIHNSYFSQPKDHQSIYMDIDSNFKFKNYKDNWHKFNRWQRGFAFWHEVHQLSFDIKNENKDIPYFFMKFEDMIKEDNFSKLVKFCKKDTTYKWSEIAGKIDKHQHKSIKDDFKKDYILGNPNFEELLKFMNKHGYKL